MKIILSRKGFDSGSGGVPSPILPDGRLVSLPIPSKIDPHTYDQLSSNVVRMGRLVTDLTRGKVAGGNHCHLDPDLDPETLTRRVGWRPAFGQIDAAQQHLFRRGVTVGDLFLFFGWFRAVDEVGGRWRYIPGAPDLHVIFGWLHAGSIIPLYANRAIKVLLPYAEHPHLHGRDRPSNTLYIASEGLMVAGSRRPGGGVFTHLSDGRVLTDSTQAMRSVWRLPAWVHPANGSILSYHEAPTRWRMGAADCILSSAARGQEFVLVPRDPHAADPWLLGIFAHSDSNDAPN